MILVKVEDREYEFDLDFEIEETFLFQDKAGVGVAQILPELDKANPYVLLSLIYMLKRRNREAVRWEDLKKLRTKDIAISVVPDKVIEEAEEDGKPARENPTSRSGRTRAKGTTAT